MAPPKRSRPWYRRRSNSGSFWREYMLAIRGHCFVRRMPPASSPRKCGARMTMRSPARACRFSKPSTATIFSTRSGLPHHRMPRSTTVRTKARKCARASASRLASGRSGKHFAKLMRVTLRRSGMSQNVSEPSASPIAATARKGRKCASHIKPNRSLLKRVRTFGHLVAVVAPQVLARAFAHQLLERAVEPSGRAFSLEPFRERPKLHHVAAAPRQPAPENEKAAYAFAPGELRRECHGVGRSPEDLGPFAFAFAGHLVGEEADSLPVLEGLQERPHTARVGRREPQVRPAASLQHHRLEPALLRRPVEHGKRRV